MPDKIVNRCPPTCPKVIQQRKEIELRRRQQSAAKGELEQNNVTFNEPAHDFRDAGVQNSENSLGSSSRSESCRTEMTEGSSSQLSRKDSRRGIAVKSSTPALCQKSRILKDFAGSAIALGPPASCHSKRPQQSTPSRKALGLDRYCTCSLSCLVSQLTRDKLIKSAVASLVFFGLCVKLCFELEAWTIPRAAC